MKKTIKAAFSAVLVILFLTTMSFNAFADEPANLGEVEQIVPAGSQETGPAFDASLNSSGSSQQSAEVGPGVGGSGNVDSGRPMVAITFDDGPHGENTPRLLSILEQYGAKATFFVVGSRVSGREAILQRAIADGCEIGNHSWGHENLRKANHSKTVSTLTATSDAIQAACGVRPVVMRPPGGAVDAPTLGTIGSLGMSSILWNIDTLDWKTRNAQATINSVLSKVQDGDIILMHDIHSPTIDACGVIIPELINRGYQLVTVSELAAARGGLVPGGNYHKFRPQ